MEITDNALNKTGVEVVTNEYESLKELFAKKKPEIKPPSLERKVLDAVSGHDADEISEILLLTLHRYNGLKAFMTLLTRYTQ